MKQTYKNLRIKSHKSKIWVNFNILQVYLTVDLFHLHISQSFSGHMLIHSSVNDLLHIELISQRILVFHNLQQCAVESGGSHENTEKERNYISYILFWVNLWQFNQVNIELLSSLSLIFTSKNIALMVSLNVLEILTPYNVNCHVEFQISIQKIQ